MIYPSSTIMDGTSIITMGGIPASIAAIMLIIWILLMCLKIKSTKKNPELLGTVGTYSDPHQQPTQTNTFLHEEENRIQQHTVNISAADYSASSSTALNTSDNSAGRNSNDVRTPSRVLQGGVTNSIASERKLPDIPLSNQALQNGLPQDNGSISSEMYATVGYATAGEVNATRLAQQAIDTRNQVGPSYVPDPTDLASDSDGAETEADGSGSGIVGAVGGAQGGSTAKIHHPYAKVKKRLKDHPYATVKKPTAPLPPTTTEVTSNVNFHPGGSSLNVNVPNTSNSIGAPASSPGASRNRDTPLHSATNHSQETGPGQQQQFFSGDSQDSTKGYQSISVREPLRHIQHTFANGSANGLLHGINNGAHGFGMSTSRNTGDHGNDTTGMGNNNTYAAVSEASDDMYAAILEEPSYIPTGTSQSNSDTYAVINLPDEDEDSGGGDGSQTYQKLNNNRGSFKENTQLQTVNSGERPTGRDSPDHPTIHHYSKIDKSKKRRPPPPPTSQQRHSFNVDQLYAKVQKNSNNDSVPKQAYNSNSIITHNQAAPDLLPHETMDMRHTPVPMDSNGRQRVRSAYMSENITTSQLELTRPPPPPPHPPNMNPRTSPYAKRDVNYSDFEVSHYDLSSANALEHHQKSSNNNETASPRLPLPLPSKARGIMNNAFDRLPTIPNSSYQSSITSSGATSHPYPLHSHQNDSNNVGRQPNSIQLDLQIPYADEDVSERERYSKDGNGYETLEARFSNNLHSQSHTTPGGSKEYALRSSSTGYGRVPEEGSNLNASFDQNRSFAQNHRHIHEDRLNIKQANTGSTSTQENNKGSKFSHEQFGHNYSESKNESGDEIRATDMHRTDENNRSSRTTLSSTKNIPKSPISKSEQSYNSALHEPPYAKLVNERDSEDEEEGYETIPPNLISPRSNVSVSFSTSKDHYRSKDTNHDIKEVGFGASDSTQNLIVNESGEYDPGYEIVPTKKGSSDAGYETVTDKTKSNDTHGDNYNTITDYGYETVKESNTRSQKVTNIGQETFTGNDPGYETLVHHTPIFDRQETTMKIQERHAPQLYFSTSHEIADPGYETVPMYSEPIDFVPKGVNHNNNNTIKNITAKSVNDRLHGTYQENDQQNNQNQQILYKTQHANSTNQYHQKPSPPLNDTSQGSPRIHMSVREMNSTSSVSSLGSTQSASTSVNGQERRNSSVIVIEHVERVTMDPEGSSDLSVTPNVKLKHGDSHQVSDSDIQRYHTPSHLSSSHNDNYAENEQNPQHSVNVAINSSDYIRTSNEEGKEKNNELVSAHIFV